jgi:hypothetical protein
VEVFPAFGYASEPHITTILQPRHEAGKQASKTVTFHGKDVKLQLDVSIDRGEDEVDTCPTVEFKKVLRPGMLGEGVVAKIVVEEGQAISFIIRNDIPNHITENITSSVLDSQQHDTQDFWYNWISKCKYKGRWREVVNRSLLILKMMTYEPTGAIIAAPTFSIPEDIGGVRYVLLLSVEKLPASDIEVIGTGTIVTRGFVIPASQSTSCCDSGSLQKPMPTWNLSANDS